MKRRFSRGMTLAELLVVALVLTVVGSGMALALQVAGRGRDLLLNRGYADATAREGANELIVRLLPMEEVTAASANSLTCTDTSGNSIQFWLSGTSVQTSTNNQNTKSILTNVQSLQFTYLGKQGTTWSQTNGSTPSIIGVVLVKVTSTVNGIAMTSEGSARLRNKIFP